MIDTNTPSVLTKKQEKTCGPRTDDQLVRAYGKGAQLTVTIRHDDSYSNGHNSFSFRARVTTFESRRRNDSAAFRAMSEEVSRLFPELAPLEKWHTTSTDGPTHYIENTMYWLGYRGYCDGKPGAPPNLKNAREIAVWPDMSESFLMTETLLKDETKRNLAEALIQKCLHDRLTTLMTEFRAAVESLGFVY